MKNWNTFAKIIFWFGVSMIVFIVLRLLLPAEYVPMVAGIPGVIFASYMANLGVKMARNPIPPPDSSLGQGPSPRP